jgi:hypothetical protein
MIRSGTRQGTSGAHMARADPAGDQKVLDNATVDNATVTVV